MTNNIKRSFTVIGAGRSGVGISKLLASRGNSVALFDENPEEKLKYFNGNELKALGVECVLGEWQDRLMQCDAIVKSPGVPPANAIMIMAAESGTKVISEIEAAYEYCPCPIVAVTGTNGKTTTTVLTGEIFKADGIDTKVCGNVGLAFSEVIDELTEESLVVLEVSSYQLNDIDLFAPAIGVILNITPDHLDWHGGFENYLAAKMRIAENMNDECLLVINYDDMILRKESARVAVPKAYFGLSKETYENCEMGAYESDGKVYYFNKEQEIHEELMDSRDINIRGRHNLYNSLASAISARSFGIRKEIIATTLQTFAGVEHRIEFVRELNGVKYFNDSKATNIESMIVALEAFDGNIVLIMGGREKGNDYAKITELVRQKVKSIIAIGESREKIVNHFRETARVVEASDMDDAVRVAYAESRAGDSVLLSPACKSFDMFESFEHRGEVFKKSVNALK